MFNLSKIYNVVYLSFQRFIDIFLNIFSFLYIRIYLILLLGFNAFIWLTAYYININVSQDLVILHYNVSFGVDLIGNVSRIYIIPWLGLIIIILNFILLFIFSKYKHFNFIAHLLLMTCLISNLFLFLALLSVYLINFR